jgi:hypothetical protein
MPLAVSQYMKDEEKQQQQQQLMATSSFSSSPGCQLKVVSVLV